MSASGIGRLALRLGVTLTGLVVLPVSFFALLVPEERDIAVLIDPFVLWSLAPVVVYWLTTRRPGLATPLLLAVLTVAYYALFANLSFAEQQSSTHVLFIIFVPHALIAQGAVYLVVAVARGLRSSSPA